MGSEERKADFLITLVGTSAMPNLIGVVTRINENGTVFLVHTEETKKISQNLCNFLECKGRNIRKELLQIDNYDNPEGVYSDIFNKFNSIYSKIIKSSISKPLVEINYTGGTKVISSISCSVFKKIFNQDEFKLNLTYLDGEESKIKIFNFNDKKEVDICYSSDLGTIPLSITDVINVHNRSNDVDNSGPNKNHNLHRFSKDMFNYIVENLGDRQRIIEYLNGLYNELGKGGYKRSKNKVENFLNEFSMKHNLLEGYNSFNDFFDALNVKEEELNNDNIKPSVNEILTGNWFEEIIYQVLLELKNEKIIDDMVNNVSRGKKGSGEFEIDFIAMKDYKLYFFSVSTADEAELTKFKLYEIKQRSKILSETESAVATITFVSSKDEIIEGYKNIWEEEPKNTCIITYNDLPRMKSLIKQWIIKKGCL